jgi:hypothetical protein
MLAVGRVVGREFSIAAIRRLSASVSVIDPARWRVDRSTTIASLMVEAVHTGSAAWVLR